MLNILCLHGLGSSSAAFDGLKQSPALQDFAIIAHDCAGHRLRPGDTISDLPLREAAMECVEAIRQSPRPTVLIGHSMGGATAMIIARMLPEKIAGLISIEGNLIGADCGILSRKLAAAQGTLETARVKNDAVKSLLASRLPGWQNWITDIADVPAETLQTYARELVALSDSGALLRTLQEFDGPKCYLYSDEYNDQHVLQQLQDIPACPVPDAGHFMMQDQPETCAQYIRAVCDAAAAYAELKAS